MREHQNQQSMAPNVDTERMAESTMNQGQQTIEQLIDLQRNMARMTLSAIEWQETAQRQGLEMTKSMLESAPGPKFTESMMRSYLQGMEAIMPEMERAMERGVQAAAQSQPHPQTQMSGSMQTGERGMHAGDQQIGGRETSGSMDDQHRTAPQGPSEQRATPQGPPEQRAGENRPRDQGQPRTGDRERDTQPQFGGRSRPQESPQYPQTGEWVSPAEYGGEPSGETGAPNQPTTGQPGRSLESASHQHRGTSGERGPGGAQQGEPFQSGGRSPRDPEYDRPSRGRESPGVTGQGRVRDQYSERTDIDRPPEGEPHPSSGRGREGRQGQRGQFSSLGPETDHGDERAPDRREQTESDETDQLEEMDVSSSGSEEATEPDSDHEEESEIEEE